MTIGGFNSYSGSMTGLQRMNASSSVRMSSGKRDKNEAAVADDAIGAVSDAEQAKKVSEKVSENDKSSGRRSITAGDAMFLAHDAGLYELTKNTGNSRASAAMESQFKKLASEIDTKSLSEFANNYVSDYHKYTTQRLERAHDDIQENLYENRAENIEKGIKELVASVIKDRKDDAKTELAAQATNSLTLVTNGQSLLNASQTNPSGANKLDIFG